MMKKLSFFLCALLFAAQSFADVTEPKTGVAFPESKDAGGKSLALAGAGLRSKMMVKVYAGALYLDPAVKTELASFKGQATKPTQALYDAICKGTFAKLFVLHFVRDVGKDKITESFSEGLEKSMDVQGANASAVKTFLDASAVDMKEGQVLAVMVSGDEVVVTTPTGESKTVKSAALAAGVPAIWLGKDPVSEDLKKGMVSRLPSLL